MLIGSTAEIMDLGKELSRLGYLVRQARHGVHGDDLHDRMRSAALWLLDAIGEPVSLPVFEMPAVNFCVVQGKEAHDACDLA